MAVTVTDMPVSGVDCAATATAAKTHQRRHITPQAGRALEILGHAIEYLTDEYVHETEQISAKDPQVQAIQILMALNRQIYFGCPIKLTFRARLCALFHTD